jgi:glutaconate CoA-transferase subunit A
VLAAGTLPGFYIAALALAPNGCWPLSLPDYYPADLEHLAEYARLAATPEGFARYLEQYVHERRAA